MKRILFLTVIAITLPLILFAFVGCMKNPELKADYGPKVTSEKIGEALNEGAELRPETIKMDQYVSLEGYMGIDTRPPETTYQRLDEVVKYEQPVQDGKIYSVATFNVTTRELVNGGWKEYKLGNLGLVVDVKPVATTAFQSRDTKESGLTIQSIQRLAAAAPEKYTFHNLTKESGVMPVPAAVSSRPDCGGLPEMVCRNGLRYVKVKFDQVYWETPDHGIKTAFTLISSSDVPTYIESWDNLNPEDNSLRVTNQIKGCGQTWMELSDGTNKQTVPVMNCMELRDFQFGHD